MEKQRGEKSTGGLDHGISGERKRLCCFINEKLILLEGAEQLQG